MLSYAARYYPIWQALQQLEGEFGDASFANPDLPHRFRVLEVGSGAEGLALFWKGHLTGVDVRFKRRPLAQGVMGTAFALPFIPNCFHVVLSCDLIEHLPPPRRRDAVLEMLRLCGNCLLLGFPSGDHAWKMYQELSNQWGSGQPLWLQEHLAYGLPAAEEVAGWIQQAGWNVRILWYESAKEHAQRIWWERAGWQRWVSYLTTRLFGPPLIRREHAVQPTDPMRVLLHATRSS